MLAVERWTLCQLPASSNVALLECGTGPSTFVAQGAPTSKYNRHVIGIYISTIMATPRARMCSELAASLFAYGSISPLLNSYFGPQSGLSRQPGYISSRTSLSLSRCAIYPSRYSCAALGPSSAMDATDDTELWGV